MSEQAPESKEEVMELLHAGWSSFQATIAALGEAQWEAKGADGWAIKDHLVHLALWERGIAALLRGQSRSAAMGVDDALLYSGDSDRINAAIHEQRRDATREEALALLRESHGMLLEALEGLSWQDLHRGYEEFQPGAPARFHGQPVGFWLPGNTWGHFAEHEAWLRASFAPP